MMMNIKEIQKLIKIAKKSGLIHIKVGDIELDFTKEAIKKEIIQSKEELKNDPNDEMKNLFWSVQNVDPFKEIMTDGQNNS